MKLGIIGAGGFGQEVYWSLLPRDRENAVFFVDDAYCVDANTIPLSRFNPFEYRAVVAVGNSMHRKQIVERLPAETRFFTHIHNSVLILSPNVIIEEGSIICAGTIITNNVKLGKHTHLNLNTTIGHDTVIGNFFTTAPGVNISGNCNIQDCVYVGTNSAVKQKINICSDVIIGMNAGVVKDINEPGTYIGTPAKKLLE